MTQEVRREQLIKLNDNLYEIAPIVSFPTCVCLHVFT